MKFEAKSKSLYDILKDYDKHYVELAIKSFSKEKRTLPLLRKKFGPMFDGEGSEKVTYAESESIDRILIRIKTRVKVIASLAETYGESDAKILNKFKSLNDAEIVALTNAILHGKEIVNERLFSNKNSILIKYQITEDVLSDALSYAPNSDYGRIYMYYYGINRPKMSISKIIELFPDYDEDKIKKILEEVQVNLSDYIAKANEVLTGSTVAKSDVKKLTKEEKRLLPQLKDIPLYNYFYGDNETYKGKAEKHDIVLDFIDANLSEDVSILKKVYDDNFEHINPDMELSNDEQSRLVNLVKEMRSYVERVYDIRHGHRTNSHEYDRVYLVNIDKFKPGFNDYFLIKNDGNNKKLITLKVINYYLDNNLEVKSYLNKFYDMNLLTLRSNVYYSKNDITKFKNIIADIKKLINHGYNNYTLYEESLSKYYQVFGKKKSHVVKELAIEYINTLDEDKKNMLIDLYGKSYDKLNIFSNVDISEFTKIKDDMLSYIEKKLDILDNYKLSLFDYFTTSHMSNEEKEFVKSKALEYLNYTVSLGKGAAQKLYGDNYDKLNTSIVLNEDEKNNLSVLISATREYVVKSNRDIQREKNNIPKARYGSIYDYFIDSRDTIEQTNILKAFIKELIDKDSSVGKDLIVKYFGNEYNDRITQDMSKEEHNIFANSLGKIRYNLFNKLYDSLFDSIINKRIKEDNIPYLKDYIISFIDNTSSETKNILIKAYGNNYDSLQNEEDLTSYDKYVIYMFIKDLRSSSIGIIKKKNKKKPQHNNTIYDYFIDKRDTDEHSDIIISAVRDYINKDTGKGKDLVIKYFGNEYDDRIDACMSKEDLNKFVAYVAKIKFNLFNKLFPHLYDYVITSKNTEENVIKIKEFINTYIDECDDSVKEVLAKAYGSNYDELISGIELTNYELYVIRKFTLDLREQVKLLNRKRNFAAKNAKIKAKKHTLPEHFLDFLDELDLPLSKEERINDCRAYLGKSKSKFIDSLVKLYGTDYNTLNESIKPTSEDIKNIGYLKRDIKKRYKNSNGKIDTDYSYSVKLKTNILDNFNISKIDYDDNLIINRFNFNLLRYDSVASKLLHKVYGYYLDNVLEEEVPVNKDDVHAVRHTFLLFEDYISKRKLVKFDFKDNFMDYCESMSINDVRARFEKLNSTNDRRAKKVISFAYDENLRLKHPLLLEQNELDAFNVFTNKFKTKFELNNKYTNTAVRGRVEPSFYDYFLSDSNSKISDDTKRQIINIVNNSYAKDVDTLKSIYGEDLNNTLVETYVGRDKKVAVRHMVDMVKTQLNRTIRYTKFRIPDNFYAEFFNEDDTEEMKKSIIEYLNKYNDASRSLAIPVVRKSFDKDGNRIDGVTLTSREKSLYRSYIYQIRCNVNLLRENIKNDINKKLYYPNKKSNLYNNFMDNFITNSMSDQLKNLIIKIFDEEYLPDNKFKGASVYHKLYDENHILRDNVLLSREEYIDLYNFKDYFRRKFIDTRLNAMLEIDNQVRDYLVVNNKLRDDDVIQPEPLNIDNTDTNEKTDGNILDDELYNAIIKDMTDLGENSYLVLTNDIIDIKLVNKQENVNIDENILIIKAYNELHDSNAIMDLLEISDEYLLNFYLNNLEKLDNSNEALRFILSHNSTHVIKQLMISPLFIDTVNSMSDSEREVLYLKLVQVNNESLTDEIISTITGVPLEYISSYEIMSKEDNINELNNCILKRK